MAFVHKSVLLKECIDSLSIRPDGIYLDGTLGGAGHSLEIVQRSTHRTADWGGSGYHRARKAAQKRLEADGDRVTLVHSNFSAIDENPRSAGDSRVWMECCLIRGFPPRSWMKRIGDFPIWRMRRWICESTGRIVWTAFEVVNQWPREELQRILFDYGEEGYAPSPALRQP